MSLARTLGHTARWCGSSLGLILGWAAWLALGALLALQLWVATHRELPLPDFALRALERRLAASEVTARFGRAIFDPAGRVVIEDIRLFSSDYATPLLTVRAAYAKVDFWALLVGSLRLEEIRLTGAELHLPAMLSPSGTDEALVSDLDGLFRIGRSDYAIDLCTFRLAGAAVTARGGLHLPASIRPRAGSLPMLDLVLQRYLKAGRKLVALRSYLEPMEEPRLDLVLTPSDERGALVDARLFVGAYHQPAPVTLTAAAVHAAFPLLGATAAPVRAELEADEIAWTNRGAARHLRAWLTGTLAPDRFAFSPQSLQATAADGEARGIPFTAPLARLAVEHLPRVEGSVSAEVGHEPQTVRGDVDFKQGRGTAAFEGSLPPLLLRHAAAIPGFTAARWVTLQDPVRGRATVELDPGWKPVRAEADVAAGRILAHEVQLDDARAHVVLAGRDLRVTDLVLHQGANEARGSYAMNLATRDYRFLLRGRLRPLDISGWFKAWWPNFWRNFDFPAAPPAADVDVNGRWGAPERSAVFCHADAEGPVVRGVPFDHVRTTLFVRPYYYDVAEFNVSRGGHSAHGRFLLTAEPHRGVYRTLDFEGESDLDPVDCARLYGPVGEAYLAPYGFAAPPQVRADGHLAGPDAPGGRQTRINFELTSAGRTTFHGIPLDGLKFTANLDNEILELHHVEATVGDGALSGDAHLSGPTGARQLAFDARLRGANLGHFIDAVENYQPLRKLTGADQPKSRFLEQAGNCELDLALKAEGRYQDILSYRGQGSFRVHGHELVEIPLLKLLFELLSKSLLNFKSQRLDTAQSSFTVEERRLVFPDFKITGPSAAIEGGGVYQLDAKSLDFTAKISPFKEHRFVLTDVLGAALSPILSTLEVRLTGQLANPSWSLTFLRSLAPARPPGEAQPGPAPGAAPAPAGIELVPDEAAGGTPPASGAQPAPPPANPAPTGP